MLKPFEILKKLIYLQHYNNNRFIICLLSKNTKYCELLKFKVVHCQNSSNFSINLNFYLVRNELSKKKVNTWIDKKVNFLEINSIYQSDARHSWRSNTLQGGPKS